MPSISSNILAFGKYFMPDMYSSVGAAFHEELEEDLRDIFCEKTVIVAPRGTAKSSICAETYPLWHIFAEDKYLYDIGVIDSPKIRPKYIVIISKTQREAKARLSTIKTLLGNKGEDGYSIPLRKKMGNWGEETARVWQSDFVVLKNGTAIRAVGTRQPIRGMKQKFQRPTLALVDDPEDEENTRTPEAMERNLRWLEQGVIPALSQVGSNPGRCLVIGTPINTSCMVVKLFNASGWKAKWYKNDAESNISQWFQNGKFVTYQGVLWPEVFSREKLLTKRDGLNDLGIVSSYYREYEAQVVGQENQIFKPEYIRWWDGYLKWDATGKPYLLVTHESVPGGSLLPLETPKEVPVLVFTGIDPSSTVSETSDYFTIVNIAFDADDNEYHVGYVRKRFEPSEGIDAIATNHKGFKPFRGMYELTAAFEYVRDYLWRDHRIRYVPDKPLVKKKGEGGRIERLQPIAARGQRWFKHGMHDLMSEHINYPNGHDDLMDAEEKAVRVAGATRPDHKVQHQAKSRKSQHNVYDPMLA